MKGHLDEDRKFFLEVIDDLAEDEVIAEQVSEDMAKGRLKAEVDRLPDPDEVRSLSEETAESRRRRLSQLTAADLLFARRMAAKSLCMLVLNYGHLHAVPWSTMLRENVERLQFMDAEIDRRHLGRVLFGADDQD
jgi:hypothetical protein